MSKATPKQAAYNQGYVDAINARPANPTQTPSHLAFYYSAGHTEGWPKRLIPTTIMTPRGPITERCSLERALYLAANNLHTTTRKTA
jgi:hypothetical protein